MEAEKLREYEETFEKIDKLVSEASERVLFPEENCVRAVIADNDVELRPLPISYSKQLGKRLQEIMKLSSSSDKKDQEVWSSSADELIIDALSDIIVTISKFYKIDGISRQTVQDSMTTSEIKVIIEAQARLNEQDDFLLTPLQAILGILSKATQSVSETLDTVNTTELEEKVSSIADSARSGE